MHENSKNSMIAVDRPRLTRSDAADTITLNMCHNNPSRKFVRWKVGSWKWAKEKSLEIGQLYQHGLQYIAAFAFGCPYAGYRRPSMKSAAKQYQVIYRT